MAEHAILSPSGAGRWMVCTPSARLEEQFPDTAGQAAAEGTLAHVISERIVSYKNGVIAKPVLNKALTGFKKNELYQPEMLGHCEEFAAFVMERFAEAQTRDKSAILMTEQLLDLTKYIPAGFGTGDVVIIADHMLEIIDLKYGKGVPVSAERNAQMMVYALGALEAFGFAFDISEVRMSIHQPRIDNHSSWIISVEDLIKWAHYELIPLAKKAFDGIGDFVAGKHCQFCRAKNNCRANAEYQLQLARYDFKDETLLSDAEIADILTKEAEFKKWLTGVKQYALYAAVTENKKWPGFKVVEGKANRKYADPADVEKILKEHGFKEEDFIKRELIGITAMKGLTASKFFKEHIEPELIKPQGKPALVPVSDKRPELDSVEAAKVDFSDDYEED